MWKKNFFGDERSQYIYYRIGSRMYGITSLLLLLAIWYRRNTLGQSISEYRDIRFIFFGTGIAFLAGNLYYGGIVPEKFKQLIIRIFVGVSAFTSILGYSLGKITNLEEFIINIFHIIIGVTIITSIYYFFIYLGSKKDESDLK